LFSFQYNIIISHYTMSICLAGTKILRTVDGGCELNGTVSKLITWQDQRCSANFLSSLPASAGPISAGSLIFHAVHFNGSKGAIH